MGQKNVVYLLVVGSRWPLMTDRYWQENHWFSGRVDAMTTERRQEDDDENHELDNNDVDLGAKGVC